MEEKKRNEVKKRVEKIKSKRIRIIEDKKTR